MMSDRDQVTKAFKDALASRDPEAQVDVEEGSADYLHVVVVSRSFENQSIAERNRVSREALRSLGPTLAVRVTVVMLLTPSEFQDIRNVA